MKLSGGRREEEDETNVKSRFLRSNSTRRRFSKYLPRNITSRCGAKRSHFHIINCLIACHDSHTHQLGVLYRFHFTISTNKTPFVVHH